MLHVYDSLEDIVFILVDARTGKLLLNLIKTLLVLQIQNAEMERMFSKMRHTTDRALLKEAHLEDILRMMEESLLEVYNPIGAISI